MPLKRMALELGMGTDIRGSDSTKAATRALRDALWRNALTIAPALGLPPEAMQIEVRIGVPAPETVDTEQVLAILPYGQATIEVIEGGLSIPHPDRDDATLIAHAAAVVYLDVA